VPDAEMCPGIYNANCESAWLDYIAKGSRAIFQFCVIGPTHEGTALRMWVPVGDAGGFVSPIGRYAKYCEIALGRPLTRADDIGNPNSIFSTRNFQVQVGYSKTQHKKGGGFSDKNPLIAQTRGKKIYSRRRMFEGTAIKKISETASGSQL
jgi:hypothetical protein